MSTLEPVSLTAEKKFSTESPTNRLAVRLPKIYDDETASGDKTPEVLLGVHTDMLYALLNVMRDFKPTTQERLYIKGRVLKNHETKTDELYSHPVFEFFWAGRSYRASDRNQGRVLAYLLPTNSKLTEEEVRTYAHMNFSPDTLSKEIGFDVGWFRVKDIYGMDMIQGIFAGNQDVDRMIMCFR